MLPRIPSSFYTVLVLLCVVAVTSSLSLVLGSAGEPASTDDFIDEQRSRIEGKLERYDIPGVAVALVEGGEITWAEGFGEADGDSGKPVTDVTRFEAGSIAKSLTAWGVMRLVEQGAVSLNSPIQDYLLTFELPDTAYAIDEITVERLMSNSSGMPFAIDFPSVDGVRAGEADAADLMPEQEPGAGFIYSNPGWVLLAMLIEDVSGMSYPDYMQQEILEPLGMKNSGFGWDDEFGADAATGYTFDGEPVSADAHGPFGAGGLYTTSMDLAHFLKASMDDPGGDPAGADVLLPESVEALHSPHVEIEGGYHGLMSESYGLGHFVESLPDGYTGITHGGESEGWLTAYYLVPETGDGLVLLSNSRRSWPIVRLLEDWAIWRDLPSTVMTRSYAQLQLAIYGATGLFSAGSMFLLGIIVFGFARGNRQFGAASAQRWPWRLLQVVIAVALLITWWTLGRNVVGPFFPVMAGFLGLSITVYAGLLLLLGGTVRTPDHFAN